MDTKKQFAVTAWMIGGYVVIGTAADNLSDFIGISRVITAPLTVLFAAAVLYFIAKKNLALPLGLCRPALPPADLLYYLPLAVLASINLWGSVTGRIFNLTSLLFVMNMIPVGFLEELMFRGMLYPLFKKRWSAPFAAVLSSLIFGALHLTNLLSGASVFHTLLQVCYAAALGLVFCAVYEFCGSLLPCIITHSTLNTLAVFSTGGSRASSVFTALVLIAVSLWYAHFLHRKSKVG